MTETVIVPSIMPQSETPVVIVVQFNSSGSGTTILQSLVQPFASVTVTVCIPAESIEALASTSELSQRKEYGVVPPVGNTEALPSNSPLQLTLDSKLVVQLKASGSVISTEQTLVHIGLTCSLIVTI